MVTTRKFCRFSRSATAQGLGMPEVPADGMCLSAFVVLSSAEHPSSVLLGKIEPSAPWDHLGALDTDRVQAWQYLWMLPASHLLVFESPQEAAARVLREQLRIPSLPLMEPKVVSEVYAPVRFPNAKQHWDIEFIFRGKIPESSIGPLPNWKELEFVDTRSLDDKDMARSHIDILSYAGF